MSEEDAPARPAAQPGSDVKRAALRPPSARTVTSGELFAGGETLLIDHRGSVYCLRQTSTGKLILTK